MHELQTLLQMIVKGTRVHIQIIGIQKGGTAITVTSPTLVAPASSTYLYLNLPISSGCSVVSALYKERITLLTPRSTAGLHNKINHRLTRVCVRAFFLRPRLTGGVFDIVYYVELDLSVAT